MELPPTASGVQKFIDKGMWEKSRQVTKSVGNKQAMRKDLDNEDPEQYQEMQQFSDNFRSITPSGNYETAFAQLWSGKPDEGSKSKDKNKKTEKKDPWEKLENDPFKNVEMSRHGVRVLSQSWKCWKEKAKTPSIGLQK